MKLQKLSLFAALAAFLCALSIRTAAAAEVPPTQLAVINIVKVYASLEQRKDGDAEIDALDRKMEKERRDKEEDLKKRNDSINPAHPTFKIDSPEYKQAQEDLIQATMNYKVYVSMADQRHLMMYRLKTIEIYRKINDAVEKYAKANGIAIVFVVDDIDLESTQDFRDVMAKITGRKILYAHPNFDITEKLIKNMNAEYTLGKQ